MKSLIVLYSYHHNNTRKIAETISNIIGANIKSPMEIKLDELIQFDLIGFGSGIDSGKHYKELLEFAAKLPNVEKKKCFIFSTSAMQGVKKVASDHAALREVLLTKGYQVVGEYSCKGYNTNSFLKYIGGINKNRPNLEDIENAKKFATKLLG
ncbi:flavodoxin family protein [Mycoplasmatota bacterium WC30]